MFYRSHTQMSCQQCFENRSQIAENCFRHQAHNVIKLSDEGEKLAMRQASLRQLVKLIWRSPQVSNEDFEMSIPRNDQYRS